MNKRIQSQPVVSLSSVPAKHRRSVSRPSVPEEKKPVESGLLRLCQEIAGTLLRRQIEVGDPVRAVREMRQSLVKHLPCDQERAGHLVDLALELLHVKANGCYRRNPLELSQLIARAGNQLRNVGDN